eukprot:3804993-Amphidinium_carterae.1
MTQGNWGGIPKRPHGVPWTSTIAGLVELSRGATSTYQLSPEFFLGGGLFSKLGISRSFTW